MYRNSEGYADPTAGAALEHIMYEERQKRRLAKKKRREAAKRQQVAIRKELRQIQQGKAGNLYLALKQVQSKDM